MRLTSFTDLGLRITMRLAVLDDDDTATTSQLARQLNVSYNHAVKVVAALQRAGLVTTSRGRAGGLRLAEGATQSSVGALVRAGEGNGQVVECEGANPCPLRGGCLLRTALNRAQEAFFASLDPLTIGDVAGGPTRELLLSIGAEVVGATS